MQTISTHTIVGLSKFSFILGSPDIRTFESRSEVRTQFQHPEVRIKYKNCSKMYNFIKKNSILLLSHNEVT